MKEQIKKYVAFAKETLGVTYNNIELLMTAFTHRSYVNEHKKSVFVHNERLEFLGDAVLELVVTDYLFNKYTDEQEGILTNWRSALVRTESIGAAASNLGFEPMLRLSKGEKRGSDRARMQILANSYEAVIGSLYIDQGYDAASKFITNTLLSTFDGILESGSWLDPKSRYQEVIQSDEGFTPQYRVLNEEGPDHDKQFTVGVFINDELRAQGNGPSKQSAQVSAAEKALKQHSKK